MALLDPRSSQLVAREGCVMFEESVKAQDLVNLLLQKHREDVCVPECKTGPTHYSSSMQKFDLWVMPVSWAKPWVSGYEVKASRSDFMQDDKWPGYLPYCNLFSFVCAWGLIDPGELPDDVGLFWASRNAVRLFCKRKPSLRSDVQIPDEIFRYILMNRVTVVSERADDRARMSREQLEKFLANEKGVDRAVGLAFAAAIGKQVEARVREIREENVRLKREQARQQEEQEQLKNLQAALDELGLKINGYANPVKQLREHFGFSPWQLQSLKSAHEHLGKTLEALGVAE